MHWYRIPVLVAVAGLIPTASALGARQEQVKASVQNGTLTVNGTSGDDSIVLQLRAGDPNTLEVDSGNGAILFRFARSTFDSIVVNGKAGDDVLRADESNGFFTDTEATTLKGDAGNDTLTAFALSPLNMQGGEGDDTIEGGNGDDTLSGGPGNDLVDGNRGNDTASLGAGDDTFQWDPGDGSDVVEGGAGQDTMQFNGSNAAEKIELSANGRRLRLFRDVGAITMDANNVERVNVRTLGSADVVTVDDLKKTDVTDVETDLGGADGSADQVVVNGTAAADDLRLVTDSGRAVVDGLAAYVAVTNAEPADTLVVNGLAGDDTFTADPNAGLIVPARFDGGDGADSAIAQGSDGNDTIGIGLVAAGTPGFFVPGGGAIGTIAEQLLVNGGGGDDTIEGQNGIAGLTALTIDGGPGNDTIGGGDGADRLIGGDGNDVVDGNRGNDVALLGAGDDTFVWDPGDGSDAVEGQGGNDTMRFNGSNAAEKIDLSANGQRLRLFRDVGAITMDTDGIETVDVNALGSADTITVHDLTGTAVTHVSTDLGGFGGGGDASADRVIVEGTAGNDVITASGSAGSATVAGLAATVSIANAEAALDTLELDGLAGDDVIQANGLAADAIQLVANGGDGDDVIVGGAGNDVLTGGAGDDVLNGGPGQDTLDGGTGDNVLIQD